MNDRRKNKEKENDRCHEEERKMQGTGRDDGWKKGDQK